MSDAVGYGVRRCATRAADSQLPLHGKSVLGTAKVLCLQPLFVNFTLPSFHTVSVGSLA